MFGLVHWSARETADLSHVRLQDLGNPILIHRMSRSISQLTDELFRLIDCLTAAGVDYAVCGGLAVALHGYPRATRDIDLLIHRASLDEATTAIEAIGYTIPGGLIPFGAGTPEAREVLRVPPIPDEELLTLDLILVTPIFDDVWRGRNES